MNKIKIHKLLHRQDILLWIYVVVVLAVSIAEYMKGPKLLYGESYVHYNNFMIFKHSFFNLINQLDLYQPHPDQFFDLYKYSPAFALLMAPLALLPDLPGLIVWNALNMLPVLIAIRLFPTIRSEVRPLMLWLLIVDLMTSMHNSQSNGLMTALFLIAYNCFESRKVAWAALCIVLSVYIKLFGAVFAVMFLMYPDRLRFLLWSLGWTLLFSILPIVVVPFDWLIYLYKSWYTLLTTDFGEHYGLSIFGIMNKWFALRPDKVLGILSGVVLVLLPLLKVSQYRSLRFRQLFFASLLIWVVIFNHKAESPTFVIAMAGIVVFYFANRATLVNKLLLALSVLLVSFSPTDLFPSQIRGEIIVPYLLKALPAVLVWGVIQVNLWRCSDVTEISELST